MKQCSTCKLEKPLAQYWVSATKRDGLMTQCKACVKRPSKGEVVVRTLRRAGLGVSLVKYLAMVQHQDNRCAICRGPETAKGKKLAVDHCHASGEVRGLLCTACNLSIGHFKDRVDFLQNARTYLER